jgi:hypothetical protein
LDATREWVEKLRGQTCNQFARTTPIKQLPTLLRRIASDLDKLPQHIVLDLTIDTSYVLDEATATVYFAFDEEEED